MVSCTQILTIITICLLAIVWVLYVVSNALASWGLRYSYTYAFSPFIVSKGHTYTYGLWKYCISDSCTTYADDCGVLIDGCSKLLLVTRAFITMACIITPLAVACFVFVLIRKEFDSKVLFIGKIATLLSFSFGLIGMAVGIYYFTTQNFWYMGAASIISAVAVFLNLITACAAPFIGFKMNPEHQSKLSTTELPQRNQNP